MTEPASTSLVASTALAAAATATTLLPGIDGDALIGAIAGGALFVTGAKDLPLIRRAIYLFVSAGAGYLAAPEVLAHLPLQSVGVAAFLAGASVVTVATQLLERLQSLDLSSFFKRGG